MGHCEFQKGQRVGLGDHHIYCVGTICLIDLPCHRLSPPELCIIFCEIDHLHATFAIGNGTYSGVGEGVLDDHRRVWCFVYLCGEQSKGCLLELG